MLYLNVVPSDASIEGDKGKINLVAYQYLTPSPIGTYLLATDVAAEKQVLQAVALESFDAFVVLINAADSRKALFFNLNLLLVTNYTLYYMHDHVTYDVPTMSCGDVDQKRKDMIVATTSGRLYSFRLKVEVN